MTEITLTKQNFKEEITNSDKVVLVDFWAPWCGPCQMMGPVISQIAESHPQIKVCKCNVDEQTELANQFQVLSIPFLALFKNGELIKTTVGFQTKEGLEKYFLNDL